MYGIFTYIDPKNSAMYIGKYAIFQWMVWGM